MIYIEWLGNQTSEHEEPRDMVVVKAILCPGLGESTDHVLIYSDDQSVCIESRDPMVLALFGLNEQTIYLHARWETETRQLLIFQGRAPAQDW